MAANRATDNRNKKVNRLRGVQAEGVQVEGVKAEGVQVEGRSIWFV
jgi:hypothetical protein